MSSRADVALHTLEKEAFAKFSSKQIMNLEAKILGKVLTIIDASVTDREQREAMKMLVKQAVWDTTDVVVEWMTKQGDKSGSTFPY